MTPTKFVDTLRDLKFENVFNPYSERCPAHDHEDAAGRRCDVLAATLKAATLVDLDSLWIGRDLGYRGGRRTGLAFTDDVHCAAHAARWQVFAERATRGEEVAEQTAAVVWSVLHQIEVPVFLWNLFPLHPHQAGKPLTNRRHNAREQRTGEQMLSELIGLLRPRRLVPIGNDAATAAARLYPPERVVKVRHPSYGGRSIFLHQARQLYELR